MRIKRVIHADPAGQTGWHCREGRKQIDEVEDSILISGRKTDPHTILDFLLAYVVSLFPLPSKVLKRLDKFRRDLLWHGCKDNKGYNLVKWDTTLNSRHLGGMGIRNLKRQNKSLLMKWL
ncbi:hypothetical protein H5410_012906 [Solanum commersonii]|uniref:Uncharacterized protein n=1 Tax=Solanum commersonii TaxID=4109 RepID=A0A9J6AT02_SOLCO|nr:hypothetical protein H5410_012906 [Solanum commersonii]